MKKFLMKNDNKNLERLFLLFVFVFITAWMLIIPTNNAPDEYMRYNIPHFIYKYGKLPHGGDPLLRDPSWGTSYGFFPILSYMISALFMKITSFFSTTDLALVTAARMVSTCFATGTAYFAIKIGKKIFPGLGRRWLYILLVVLLPEAIFIGAYVNIDAMAVFATAFIVYMWICGIETKWSFKTCAGLAVAMSICILSYYNAYGFLICSFLLFCCTILLCQEKPWDFSQLFKKGFFILLIVFLLAGWWFIRNYILYDGDILGVATNDHYGDLYAIDQYKPSLNPTPHRTGESLWFMLINRGWLTAATQSFIGVFGYMDIWMPVWAYFYYCMLFCAGMIGCLVKLRSLFALRENAKWRAQGFFHWAMLLSIIITNVLNLYHSYCVDYQPQGRYSLPMLLPFMYFVTYGIHLLVERVIQTEKNKKVVMFVIALGVVLIALYAFFRIIFRAYGFVHFT